MVATAANTASTRTCSGCGGVQTVSVNLVPSRYKEQHRFLVMGMIQIRGTLMRTWTCDTCTMIDDAGTKWVETPSKESEPVRDHIVYRLRGLRDKGWRFFEWEK